MKQEQREWKEYENITKEVILTSGLDEGIFHDLRGNHDSFSVPEQGDANDFYEKYSISSRLRKGDIQCVTLKIERLKKTGSNYTYLAGKRLHGEIIRPPRNSFFSSLCRALAQWHPPV